MKQFLKFIIISFVVVGILHKYGISPSLYEMMGIGLLIGTIDAFISFFFGGE